MGVQLSENGRIVFVQPSAHNSVQASPELIFHPSTNLSIVAAWRDASWVATAAIVPRLD